MFTFYSEVLSFLTFYPTQTQSPSGRRIFFYKPASHVSFTSQHFWSSLWRSCSKATSYWSSSSLDPSGTTVSQKLCHIRSVSSSTRLVWMQTLLSFILWVVHIVILDLFKYSPPWFCSVKWKLPQIHGQWGQLQKSPVSNLFLQQKHILQWRNALKMLQMIKLLVASVPGLDTLIEKRR